MNITQIITTIISRYLPIWIIVLSIIAYFFSNIFKYIQGLTGISLGIIFLLMGMSLSTKQLILVIKKPKYAFIGILFKWTIMVIVTIVIAYPFLKQMPEIASGIILSGVVPSGTSANIYTFIAGGEVALSITMATLDTIISPVLTPSLVQLVVGKFIPIDFWSLFINIIYIVFIPLFIGLFLQVKFPEKISFIKPYTGVLSQIALFVVVLSVISRAQESLQANLIMLPIIFIAVIIQVSVPMFAGFYFSKRLNIPKENMIAITFHTGICNTALSATLAMEHISSLAAVPAVANMVVNLTIGAIVAKMFEAKRNKVTPLHKGNVS